MGHLCVHTLGCENVLCVQERMTYHSTGLHISLQAKESNPDKDSAKQKYCVFKISMWRTFEIEDRWVDGFKVICFWGEWKGMRAWTERHQLYQDISIFFEHYLTITPPCPLSFWVFWLFCKVILNVTPRSEFSACTFFYILHASLTALPSFCLLLLLIGQCPIPVLSSSCSSNSSTCFKSTANLFFQPALI